MVWRKLLLAGALVALVALSIPAALAAGNEMCTPSEAMITGCPTVTGTIDGDTAVLTGDVTGTGGVGGGEEDPLCDVELSATERCRAYRPGVDLVGPVTLADIAEFRPTPGAERMEPDGWVVAGLPANIYAITAPHLVDGTLLGQPATVRFTPIRYHWSYGDGATAVRTTKGGTWAALGLREFDPTPTSHVYESEGEYTIRLTIDFRAEYRFAGSEFLPIDGTINLRANDLHVTVDGAKTVLVEHDCAADPSGPGC